jgi:UTP--glucose-1-phosphate uridylyltransferase
MKLFSSFCQARSRPAINYSRVVPPPPSILLHLDAIADCPADTGLRHELLDKIVILKLNGGLGTSMGCTWPKSAIEVRNGLSFLDLTVRQVEFLNASYGVDVPLVLMNSFKTHETTAKIIRKYRNHNLTIHTFMQSCYPRIIKVMCVLLCYIIYISKYRRCCSMCYCCHYHCLN